MSTPSEAAHFQHQLCPFATAATATETYDSYLGLERVLAAQAPKSQSPHEMLFIVQHQVSELWLKLALHELESLRTALQRDALPAALTTFRRVMRVMEQLIAAWDVLATLTPSEYAEIRPSLGSASGFQSVQYRHFEFILGNKNANFGKAATIDAPAYLSELQHPSLYDEAVACLYRAGFTIAEQRLRCDRSLATRADASVTEAWAGVYRDPGRFPSLYQLAECFVDLEASFRLWRFRHLTTVERVIGGKPGTGGSNGVPYLRKMLDVVLFPDLIAVRNQL